MDLHSFCSEMGFDAVAENRLFPYWEQLCAHTALQVPLFMKRDFYEKYYPMCQGPCNVLERMDTVAKIIAENPVCARYAAILQYGLFVASPAILGNMPPPEKFFGENAGVFQLMIAMSSLPLIAKTHASMGLPEHFLRDAARSIGGTIPLYAAAHDGIPGHTLSQTGWLRFHIDGKLFRIGRLEYLIGAWPSELPAVYRNRKDTSLAVLCRDQWTFDQAGVRVNPALETPAFTARLEILDGHVAGTPVSPTGKPLIGHKMTLDLSEWEEYCSPWDMIPGIHIPGGGGMTPEAVRTSLLEARQFFRKYYFTDVKAFVCCSWILNPAWEQELPESNIAAFQRNVFLASVAKSPTAGLFFVYGRQEGDPRNFQRNSSLHEAFCRIFDRNEPLKTGYAFILTADLDKFGTEYYRNHYPS